VGRGEDELDGAKLLRGEDPRVCGTTPMTGVHRKFGWKLQRVPAIFSTS